MSKAILKINVPKVEKANSRKASIIESGSEWLEERARKTMLTTKRKNASPKAAFIKVRIAFCIGF